MEAMDTMVALKETVLLREKREEEVYEWAFPRVAGFVSHMGGSLDDARDVFHDALVIWFELVSKPHFSIAVSEEAYILGIAKHIWINRYKQSRNTVSLDAMEKEISIPEDYFPTVENKRLLRILEVAGKKCMDLLRAFYFEQLSVKRLVQKLGYANEHTASVQKYKCLGKIRETIKEKSLAYEDFMD